MADSTHLDPAPHGEMPSGADPGVDASSPSSETVRRAALYWEQSQIDLVEAKRLCRASAFVESSHLSFQAAVNALASVCHLRGRVRLPNHSAVALVELCGLTDSAFTEASLLADCADLEAVQARSPFDPDPDPKLLKQAAGAALKQSDRVLKAVKRHLKSARKSPKRWPL